jgi:hypothetical protein
MLAMSSPSRFPIEESHAEWLKENSDPAKENADAGNKISSLCSCEYGNPLVDLRTETVGILETSSRP